MPLKRVTRLVVLPDYQGIGIGRAFLDSIADLYMREGFMFEIKTSARNLISSLRNDPAWRTASYCFAKDSKHQINVKGIKSRNDVKAATFVRNDVGVGVASPRLQHGPHGEETNIDVRQRCSEHDSERLQDSDVPRGRWNFYDYHPTSKPSGGRINHSHSIRTDCKVATFRSVTNNG